LDGAVGLVGDGVTAAVDDDVVVEPAQRDEVVGVVAAAGRTE
jgi:hypothetical protein